MPIKRWCRTIYRPRCEAARSAALKRMQSPRGALECGVVCAGHTEVSDITKSEHIRGGRSSDWRATYILLPAIFELKKTSLVGRTGAATRQWTTMWC